MSLSRELLSTVSTETLIALAALIDAAIRDAATDADAEIDALVNKPAPADTPVDWNAELAAESTPATSPSVPVFDFAKIATTFDATDIDDALDGVSVKSEDLNVEADITVNDSYVTVYVDVNTDKFEDDLEYDEVNVCLSVADMAKLIGDALDEDGHLTADGIDAACAFLRYTLEARK
jgi:hypothetical protein